MLFSDENIDRIVIFFLAEGEEENNNIYRFA